MSLSIAIGSDHHGIARRCKLADFLRQEGYSVEEIGPSLDAPIPTDYPDIASAVAEIIGNGKADRGILICGTGIGMCITANKFAGVRAAPIIDELSAEFCRRHNDLNVLCIGDEIVSESVMFQIVRVWLTTPFDGGRHERRINKIRAIEQKLGLS